MNFAELVTLVLADPEFRKSLRGDPGVALKDIGVDASDEQIAALENFDWNGAERIAGLFGGGPERMFIT